MYKTKVKNVAKNNGTKPVKVLIMAAITDTEKLLKESTNGRIRDAELTTGIKCAIEKRTVQF